MRATRVLLAVVVILLAIDVIVSLGVFPSAQAQPEPLVQEVIRARSIELVAENGQVVAQLHTSPDGSGNLRLRSGSGEVRVKLGATSDGAGLILMSERTEPALVLSASQSESSLTFAERGKRQRVLRP